MIEKEQVMEILGKQMEILSEYSQTGYEPANISNISLAMKDIAEFILKCDALCGEKHLQD